MISSTLKLLKVYESLMLLTFLVRLIFLLGDNFDILFFWYLIEVCQTVILNQTSSVIATGIFFENCSANIFFYKKVFSFLFSCPEQLNRWPCHWLTHSVTQSLRVLLLLTLQTDPRDLRPLRHLIRVMKRHDLTEKRPTYQHTYPVPTYLHMYLH